MPGLILILIFGIMLAYIIKKDVEDVLPPFVLSLMLGIYLTGILKKSHHAFFLSLCVFAIIAVIFILVLRKRKTSLKTLLSSAVNYFRSHPGFILYLLVCILMIFCYSTHFTCVWDDFHYNATFPKDCWYYGTMTYGNCSATLYKSYLPLQQLFFYWGFQSIDTFSEPMMFQYKMILIYTLLLPLFKKLNNQRLSISLPLGIITVILPFLFMFEVLESLSMDTVMASLFAYAVSLIITEEKRDWFCYYRIAACIISLTLIKSIALMFSGIALGIWLFTAISGYRCSKSISAKNEFLALSASTVLTAGAYMSWKLFCNINGNSVYLSNRLKDNFLSGASIILPDYGETTIQNIIKSIFTLQTNLGNLGTSLATCIIICAILTLGLIICKDFQKTDFWTVLILSAGLLVYIAFLCYTYCFLFEPWEAESLSSLDRYLGTYSFSIFYVTIYRFVCISHTTNSEDNANYSRKNLQAIVLSLTTVVMVISLPLNNMAGSIIPSNYLADRNEEYTIRNAARIEMQPLIERNLSSGIILIINNSGNDLYSRSLDYEAIPHIAKPFNSSSYDDYADMQEALDCKIEDENPDYIYFSTPARSEENTEKYKLPDNYTPVPEVEGLFTR